MRRRDLLLGASPALPAGQSPARPNILFVVSDDLNNDFGGMGRLADVRTPNLDRLARRGVRFELNYCQYPLCNPSRVSLLSGLYPATSQVLDNLTPPRYALPDFVTLPQYLRSRGYGAAYAGKVFHLLDPASWQDNPPPPAREKTKQFNYWIEPVRPDNKAFTVLIRNGLLAKSIRTDRWRYTEWDQGRRGAELYDHHRDPYEVSNQAGNRKHAETVSALRRQLHTAPHGS